MQDLRQSKEFARFMEKIGWRVEKINSQQAFIRQLPLLGAFIKIQRSTKQIPETTLDNLARKNHAFAVKVDFSPTKTLQLNLSQALPQIFSQMQKDCRYEIKKAEKNKIIVRQSEDIEAFIKMWHKNALRRGFWIPFGKEIRSIYEAFGKKAFLLLAYHLSHITSHQPIAGALILIHDKTAYYFHAASTPEGRKLGAPYLVVWEAIKLAKSSKGRSASGRKKGCHTFDFEGIYDKRFPQKSWLGFTHFKKGFGGEEVELPGPLIKFYNRLLKTIAGFRFKPVIHFGA